LFLRNKFSRHFDKVLSGGDCKVQTGENLSDKGKERAYLQFVVKLQPEGTIAEDAKGIVEFLDNVEKHSCQTAFTHWDEIPRCMRKLLQTAGYIRLGDENGWHFGKK
jgi:hypothetical protein